MVGPMARRDSNLVSRSSSESRELRGGDGLSLTGESDEREDGESSGGDLAVGDCLAMMGGGDRSGELGREDAGLASPFGVVDMVSFLLASSSSDD